MTVKIEDNDTHYVYVVLQTSHDLCHLKHVKGRA